MTANQPPTETLSTPSTSLATALDAELPDSRIAKALGDALTATQTTRSGTVEPDHRIRLAAATLALAYRHGRLIDRQQVVIAKVGGEADMIDRLTHSPELRQALRDALDVAENRSGGDGQTTA